MLMENGRSVPSIRYRLVYDDDGHDYVIPANRWIEWCRFMDNPSVWDAGTPEWAQRIDNPSQITFENWETD